MLYSVKHLRVIILRVIISHGIVRQEFLLDTSFDHFSIDGVEAFLLILINRSVNLVPEHASYEWFLVIHEANNIGVRAVTVTRRAG